MKLVMSKYWWLVLLGLVLVGLGVVGVVYYYRLTQVEPAGGQRSRTSPTLSDQSRLPKELASAFDPTVNTPVFKVITADRKQKTLKLKMVFPREYQSAEISSAITCDEADIKVERDGQAVGAGSAALFNTIEENFSVEAKLFRGLCRDSTCQEISKQCVLFLM